VRIIYIKKNTAEILNQFLKRRKRGEKGGGEGEHLKTNSISIRFLILINKYFSIIN